MTQQPTHYKQDMAQTVHFQATPPPLLPLFYLLLPTQSFSLSCYLPSRHTGLSSWKWVGWRHGFSTLARLTFGGRWLLVLEDCPGHWRGFSSISGLYSLETSQLSQPKMPLGFAKPPGEWGDTGRMDVAEINWCKASTSSLDSLSTSPLPGKAEYPLPGVLGRDHKSFRHPSFSDFGIFVHK